MAEGEAQRLRQCLTVSESESTDVRLCRGSAVASARGRPPVRYLIAVPPGMPRRYDE